MESVALQAGSILFREGLEAMLVLMALDAYMVKAGHSGKQGLLWMGGGFALLASVVAAWVFATFYGGAHNDVVEGCVMVVAAGVMLYVSGWMFIRQDPVVWQTMLKRHVDKVLSKESQMALAGVAFLAVFREGAETVLMLNALGMSGGMGGMLAGLAVGALALVAAFVAMKAFALRLPLRPLFLATSAFLFLMGLHMAAEAVVEFQEIGWMTLTPLGGEELSVESLTTVIFLALVALGGTLLARYRFVTH